MVKITIKGADKLKKGKTYKAKKEETKKYKIKKWQALTKAKAKPKKNKTKA